MNWLKTWFLISIILLSIFHFTHDHYKNIGDSGEPNFLKLIKWKFTRERAVWPELPQNNTSTEKPDFPESASKDDIVVTYINHSTMLIQLDGENILTDPIWSDYAGPFGRIGVKRSIHPGMQIDDLPKIDFILISHSHYDHLDIPTIEKLVEKHNPTIITGLGVTRYINYCKIRKGNCYELQWWENVNIYDSVVTFHFVPAYHWSSRYLIDKNTSLWGGFVISNKQNNIYFAGDTGFGDGLIFKQIKEKFGDFKLSILPIGAYKPEWFFNSMHTTPLQSVKISKILDSDYTIPIHFDTFQLSDEKYTDPLADLKAALQAEGVEESKFNILSPGWVWYLPK